MYTLYMPSYLKIMYRVDLKPTSRYPALLAAHLSQSFFPQDVNKVIDVGAGTGALASELARKGFDTFALDDMFLSAESIIPEVKQIWTSFKSLQFPIKDESFDVVIIKSVIEHMTMPLELVIECKRILSPKGRLIVLTPDWVRNKSRFYDDHTHVTPFTKISLTNLLLQAGFSKLNVQYLVPLPRTWKSPFLSMVSQIVGPFVPPRLEWKPLRWSRERQLIGFADNE